MQYRHPKAEEYAEIVKLSNVAYRADWRNGKTDEEIVAEFTKEHENDMERELAQHYLAFTDDGKVMAKVSNNAFESYLHGRVVKLGGIGGVATYAEYRRGGHIRVLMEMVLDDLYEQGYTLSYLYPFSHPFYRKFGYETHTNVVHHKLDPSTYLLRTAAPEGLWHMLRGKSDPNWAEVKSLYECSASSLNLTLKRDDDLWKRYQDSDPYAGRQTSYLFRDASDLTQAAFSFETEGDNMRIFRIKDLSFRTIDGLAAVLDFCRRFRADYDTVSLPLPENFPLNNLLTDVATRQFAEGMVRVVRVDQALSLLPNTLGTTNAKLLINVTDQQLAGNHGSFALTIHGDLEKPLVEKLHDPRNEFDYDAVLNIDICELSLLVVGSQSFTEMKNLPQLAFTGNERLFERLFPRRANLQVEFY